MMEPAILQTYTPGVSVTSMQQLMVTLQLVRGPRQVATICSRG